MLKTSPSRNLLAGVRASSAGPKHLPTEITTNLAEKVGSDSLRIREMEILREMMEWRRNR